MNHGYYMRDVTAPDGTYRLLVTGELDLHAAPELDAGIERALAAGAPGVELDLGETTFIDSTAIARLLRAYRRLSEEGVSFRILCDEPNVMRVFEVAQLEEILPISHSSRAA